MSRPTAGSREHALRRLTLERLEHRWLPASITGFVFSDADGDGNLDASSGETPIEGVVVYLDLNDDGNQDADEPARVSDARGRYAFEDVAAGTVVVRQAELPGIAPVFPSRRQAASQFIAEPDRVDHAFDPVRGLLYIATTRGTVERFDVTTETFLEPFSVGVSLSGLDIGPDGRWLYVGERQPGAFQSLVRRIDLQTGEHYRKPIDQKEFESGVVSLQVAAGGSVFLTTAARESQWNPLRLWDTGTDTVTERRTVRRGTRAFRSGDRETVFFTETGSSSGPILVYSSATDSFPAARNVGAYLDHANAAVNRDGSLIALETGAINLYDATLNPVGTVRSARAGLTFDPVREVLYAGDHVSDSLVAFDTNSGNILYQIAADQDLVVGRHAASSSPDGRFVFLSTASGIRKFTVGDPVGHRLQVSESGTYRAHFGNAVHEYDPVARADTFRVDPGASEQPLDVLQNDSLHSRGSLRVAAVGTPNQGGTVRIAEDGGSVSYQPARGFRGLESFDYTVEDGNGRRANAKIQIAVKEADGRAELAGIVWHDRNANERREAGESAASDWTVFLDINNNGLLDTGEPSLQTDNQGRFAFPNLEPETHTVGVEVPAGWTRTTRLAASSTGVLIPTADRSAVVFDDLRQRLYITTTGGKVVRYDLLENALLESWDVGVSITGADIAENGGFLVVTENQPGFSQNLVRRIDLETGKVENHAFSRPDAAGGAFDVAIGSGNMGLFSTGIGQGDTIALQSFQVESGQPQQLLTVEADSIIRRGGDRQKMLVAEADADFGRLHVYDGTAGRFLDPKPTHLDLDDVNAAVSRDNRLAAVDGLTVFTTDLTTVEILPSGWEGGLAFDANRDILFAVDAGTDELVAVDTATFHVRFRTAIGEDVPGGRVPMAVSPDGRFLALGTPGGVRLFDLTVVLPITVAVTADSVTEDVGIGVRQDQFQPYARDDVARVPTAATDHPIAVMDNDRTSLAGGTRVVDATDGVRGGTTRIDADGRRVRYSPPTGFRGQDLFRYTIRDQRGLESSAEVVVMVSDGNGLADVKGTSWEDLDGDGERDLDEPGLPDARVYLDLNRNGSFDPDEPFRYTADNGQYAFHDLEPGAYTVKQVPEPGYDPTFPLEPGIDNRLLPTSQHVDLVADPERNRLYVTQADGRLGRFDWVADRWLPPLAVGSRLTAADITEDGRFLLVGEFETSGGFGTLYKIDLDTDTVSEVKYPVAPRERGIHDIAVAENGKAFITTQYAGAGSVPLRELNLTNDSVSSRRHVRQNTRMAVGRDRNLVLFAEANVSSGPLFTYDPSTDSFSPSHHAHVFLSNTNVAVNPTGTQILLDAVGVSAVDTTLQGVQAILDPQLRGGFLYDPVRTIVYAGDPARDEVVAYDTRDFREQFRIQVGENLGAGYRPWAVTPEGKWLFVLTGAGIRMLGLATAGQHTIEIGADEVADGLDFGNWANGLNRRPRAHDDGIWGVNEDQPLTVPTPGVLANDVDPDGDRLQARLLTEPEHGTVVLHADGSLRYTPAAEYVGPDEFSYVAFDGFVESRPATVRLIVHPLNDAPILKPASPELTATEDRSRTWNLTVFINRGVETTGITDADPDDPVGGIAVEGLVGRGDWSFSLDGQQFLPMEDVAADRARLLPHDAFLQYVPDGDNGELAELHFRAWDTTTGSPGELADARFRGGTFAYSEEADILTLRVEDVNDAPVLEARGPVRATDEDTQITVATNTFINAGDTSTRVYDVDADDPVGGFAIFAVQGAGSLAWSADGITFTDAPPLDEISSLLIPPDAYLRYYPDLRNGETASIRYVAWDGSAGRQGETYDTTLRGGTTPFSVAHDELTINVTDVNDAPELSPAPPTLHSNDEEAYRFALSAFINAGPGSTTVSDVDFRDSVGGVALVAAQGRGEWAYSLDAQSFQSLPAVSLESSLLLPHDAWLEYRPILEGEQASLAFVAWDQTQGNAGVLHDVTRRGGVTAFSVDADQLLLEVEHLNDAPVLVPSASTDETDEDHAVSRTLAGWINAGDGNPVVTDADPSDVVGGVAVFATSGRGHWEYSLLGNLFTAVPAVSRSAALLIPATGSLRYVPAGDFGGEASLGFMAWDASQGAPGQTADTSESGGRTAFSAATDVWNIQITDVNDAPILIPADGARSADEDTVFEIALTAFINAGEGSSLVRDVDPDSQVGAIAVTGLVGRGTWSYDANATGFTEFGELPVGTARLLPADARLRFAPDGLNGEDASVTFRAWDQTEGVAGGLIDATLFGGITSLSADTDRLTVDVEDLNDAPVLIPAMPRVETPEQVPGTWQVSEWVNAGPGTTTITDVDLHALPAGIAITGFTGSGAFEYSRNGFAFSPLQRPAPGQAVLLLPTMLVRYSPVGDVGESAAIDFIGWDRTSGTAGEVVDVVARGGTSAFSIDSDVLTIQVIDVNDPPDDIRLDAEPVLENDPGAFVGIVTVFDPDDNDHTLEVDDARFIIVGNQLRLRPDVFLNYEEEATVTVEIRAVDEGQLELKRSFDIGVVDVNDAPTLNKQPPDMDIYENFHVHIALAHDTFVDEDGHTLTHSASLVDGEPLPSWVRFSPETLVFSGWSPAVRDPLGIRVQVLDDGVPILGAETGFVVNIVENPHPWQNPVLPLDVNADGMVSALDALIIINWVNAHPGQAEPPPPPAQAPPFYDVNGDDLITALDILIIINELNQRSGNGEGESVRWWSFESPGSEDERRSNDVILEDWWSPGIELDDEG